MMSSALVPVAGEGRGGQRGEGDLPADPAEQVPGGV
jgi:hypothetical protein